MVRKWAGLVLVLMLASCNTEDAKPFIEQGFTEEISGIEAIVEKEDRIASRQLVAADDMVLVTYEVKPTFRVQKQRVERDLKKQLEKAYPTLQFVVSGDFKLHYEAQQLAKEERSDSKNDKKNAEEKKQSIKKEIEKLKKLAEEET